MHTWKKINPNPFLSTLSLRRATTRPMPAVTRVANFYPRSPCGERQRPTAKNGSTRRFLSTLSLRRATLDARESDYVCRISIHALLAESDVSFMLYDTSSLIFLSTLSLRRATSQGADLEHKMINFYPRSPCGERRMYHKVDRERACISIHALLAESDLSGSLCCLIIKISIHALLAESDVTVLGIQHRVGISIHALLAESDILPGRLGFLSFPFLSTLSLRRATSDKVPLAESTAISIHALLAESDRPNSQKHINSRSFLSTLSLRRATPSF